MCATCSGPFEGGSYALSPPDAAPEDQIAECLTCYQKTHGRICAGCKQVVAFGEATQAIYGRDYHVSCFACAQCGTDLTLPGMKIADDPALGILCMPCKHRNSGNVCNRCDEVLTGQFMKGAFPSFYSDTAAV